MRIVHVAEVALGGVIAYLDEIAGYQSRAFGTSNVFFVLPRGAESQVPSIDPAQIVTVDYRGRSPQGLLRFGLDAARAIRRLRPDLVHLHSTFAGAVLRPILGLMPRRPRIVYCPHGWAFSMEVSDRKKTLYAAYEKALARGTDLIIVNSESERRLGLRYGIDYGRILTVMNGISSYDAGVAPREEVTSAPVQAAFIGRFDRQKGLDILLDALDEIPECALHLHLVGQGDVYGKGGPERLQRSNITAHGWLPRAEIAALLSRIDVVVMPSRWEAQGLVALEAMRSGVAVIASNRGGLPEVIRDGVDGHIFDLDDPGALPRLLRSLDRHQLRMMGESARRHFEAEFTSERMNAKLHQAYRRVLGPASDAQAGLRDAAAEAVDSEKGEP